MAIEIERKFLVNGNSWRSGTTRQQIRQGYLCSSADRTVRVRVGGDRAFLTIKGAQHGASRYEYEYGIPIRDATEMLERLCERPPDREDATLPDGGRTRMGDRRIRGRECRPDDR